MSAGRGPGFLPTKLTIDPSAFIAPGVILVGEVEVGAGASIWYGCVLRGDIEPIRVGPRSNVQDGTVIHVDVNRPTIIGEGVTVGHRAVVHGATLGDGCLIGMGAVILSGARIGEGALVAAGAVVLENMEVPPHCFCRGVAAKVVGELDPSMRERLQRHSGHYEEYARAYREGRLGGGPYGGR